MTEVRAGMVVGRDKDGRIVYLSTLEACSMAPDIWIVRRLADCAPDIAQDPNAARDRCVVCGSECVHRRDVTLSAPKVCWQCAGFSPL